MTKEKLQERLAKLTAEQAQMNTLYSGAIQECQLWLKELDNGGATDTPDANQSS